MKHRIELECCVVILIFSSIISMLAGTVFASEASRKPRVGNPARHSYPALGAGSERKVRVAWNRYYDHAGLTAILVRLNRAYPDLTRLYSIGKSTQGRDIWCLEVTARNLGDPDRKPGMYIDGNIHGNEIQTSETVAYTAWYLCHQYGRLEKITELLDGRIFYLLPSINPDGRDSWLNRGGRARSGLEPTDDDRDGMADEDDSEDLNGDGQITMMRIKDPHGRFKRHPDYPELMVRTRPDEAGEYNLLGWEGIDNDGDGRINEDGRGGYDMNRNWAYDWQPNYVQYGAKDYPFSQPETRAVAGFILAHTNIAAAQSYHNAGGMILRGPGAEGGPMHYKDDAVLALIAARGEKIIPYYRSLVLWDDLYQALGSELDWLYGGRGILSFTNELWTARNLYKTSGSPSDEQEAEFIKYVLMGDGVIPWQPYEHPTYGAIEIGGRKKEWGRVPPSFLLEEELHRNMAFTLYHADMMPLIQISEVKVAPLGENLFRIWVTIENKRLIPTRTGQDAAYHINPPDIVAIEGDEIRVLSSGRVTDRFFKRVAAVERRPERVELDTIDGMSAVRVQFIVDGKGEFTITVDSAKAGLLKKSQLLPSIN